MPIVQNHTGADRYFERLADGLRALGHRASLRFFPHRLELTPRLLARLYAPEPDVDVLHSKAEFGLAFHDKGKPLVLTLAHSVFDPLYMQHKGRATDLYHRFVKRPIIVESMRGADRVVTVSDYSRQRISEDYGYDDAIVIYNGIDEQRFVRLPEAGRLLRDRWDQSRVKLFYAGNLVRRKGADLLPRLMDELGDGFVLYFTGGIGNRSQGVAATRNMRPLGYLSDAELVAAYNECDIFVFPSRMEGFGYPVAEAMACETPVVCTRASSLPELVDDGQGGVLCEPDDVHAFARAVRALAADRDAREAMGRHNRAKVLRRFRLQDSIARYAELYAELL